MQGRFPCVPAWKAEEIVYHYIWLRGESIRTEGNVKVVHNLKKKCAELGINKTVAYAHIKEAERLGILEEARRLEILPW